MKRRSIGILVIALSSLLIASGCTLTRNGHYQVDAVPGPGYHFHIYRRPMVLIWFTHDKICGWGAGCTMGFIKEQLAVNGIFGAVSGLDFFFDDDTADFDDALRSAPHPWPLSVNLPEQYGCLGGYKNLLVPHADGDWYGDPPDRPWCPLGQPIS
jgi:hypothetical protein